MRSNDLTVKKILDKLVRNQRLAHNEEFFYLIEVLYFSEEKAEQLLSSQAFQAKKLRMHSPKFATAA